MSAKDNFVRDSKLGILNSESAVLNRRKQVRSPERKKKDTKERNGRGGGDAKERYGRKKKETHIHTHPHTKKKKRRRRRKEKAAAQRMRFLAHDEPLVYSVFLTRRKHPEASTSETRSALTAPCTAEGSCVDRSRLCLLKKSFADKGNAFGQCIKKMSPGDVCRDFLSD